MKKLVALLLSLSMIFALSACGSNSNTKNGADTQPSSESTEAVTETPTEEPTEVPTETSSEVDTEEPSEDTESAEGKTLVVYYSATGNTEEAAGYIAAATGADTLELVPVDGFIATNDFTGKTVIPFCTSASSGLGESGELLAEAAGTGNWLEGIRFSSSVSEADVQTWLDGLGL